MHIAWFRASSPTVASLIEGRDALLAELQRDHQVTIVTEREAHGFVVDADRGRFDLNVYEMTNRRGSDFIWPYLFHYPGVLLLTAESLHDSRTRVLEPVLARSEYIEEFTFNHGTPPDYRPGVFLRGSWPMLRAPLLASRLTVVEDDGWRQALLDAYPGACVRVVPPCAAGPAAEPVAANTAGPLVVQLLEPDAETRVRQAIARATGPTAPITLSDSAPTAIDPAAHVVLALQQGQAGSLAPALAGMAHGKVVVVIEREATALWSALDPQTWRPRDPGTRPPLVISLDARDEEHSLVLALKRLAGDPMLRRQLGSHARTWWLAHHTPAHAAAAWREVLHEAADLPPALHPDGWPQFTGADGTRRLHALLGEMGLTGFDWDQLPTLKS